VCSAFTIGVVNGPTMVLFPEMKSISDRTKSARVLQLVVYVNAAKPATCGAAKLVPVL
jgi:hypothetical protein